MNQSLVEQLEEISSWEFSVKYSAMLDLLKENGISITDNGGGKISNCYHSNSYKIESNNFLSKDFILFLRELGLLGYGQEFWISKPEIKDDKHIVKIVNMVDSSD